MKKEDSAADLKDKLKNISTYWVTSWIHGNSRDNVKHTVCTAETEAGNLYHTLLIANPTVNKLKTGSSPFQAETLNITCFWTRLCIELPWWSSQVKLWLLRSTWLTKPVILLCSTPCCSRCHGERRHWETTLFASKFMYLYSEKRLALQVWSLFVSTCSTLQD